ncbi:copper chaperone PCu(A)C [Parasphingorhabdus pacifica]
MSRPQHHKAVRLRLASAALGIGAAIALTGCSAGQVTETDTQVAAVDGASGETNGIAVRDAQLTFPSHGRTYPKGASAPMQLVLVNANLEADRLVGVNSPYAQSVELGGKTDLPGESALHAQPDVPGTAGQAPQPATAESGQREIKLTVQGLTREIGPGVTIPVTFKFQHAGEVTVQVPIGADPHPRPEGEHGGH